MSDVMPQETQFLLYSVGMGVFITFVYDWFRVLRRVFRHKPFLVSLEDFLFWLFSAVLVFMVLYRVGNGNLRWFAVAGALGGMWAYLKLASNRFVKGTVFVLQKTLRFLGRSFRFVKNKLTVLYKLLKMILCKQQYK